MLSINDVPLYGVLAAAYRKTVTTVEVRLENAEEQNRRKGESENASM